MTEENLHKSELNEENILRSEEEKQEVNHEAAEQAKMDEDSSDLTTKLLAKEKEAEELLNRLQRLQADFENFRRRSRKELEDMGRYGTEKVMEGLLPVMDNFSRALQATPKDGESSAFMTGMEMIYRQLKEALEKEGLQAIEAVGQPFDPEKHEAVMRVDAENQEQDNLVVDELQIGYTLHDRLLRPSMVKVAKYSG